MRDHEPAPDHAHIALEASCGALIAMESIRARIGDRACDLQEVQVLTAQAIKELRQAIKELRLAREERGSLLPRGFVLDAGSEWLRAG